MSFAVPRALPLSLLAALVLAGCAEKGAAPLKKGEKPVDVASVVRQKMPASVKDRNAWATRPRVSVCGTGAAWVKLSGFSREYDYQQPHG